MCGCGSGVWVSVWRALLCVGGIAACGVASDDADEPPALAPPPAAPDGPPVVNDAWQIVKMASGNGVFTIEIELADLATAANVARMLVDPLMDDYSEVLVYVYEDGQGRGGHLPARRIRWTADGGFDELDYRMP